MNNLGTYIIEKLKINKDIKNDFTHKCKPTKEDFKLIDDILDDYNGNNGKFIDLADKYKDDKDQLVKYWVATMIRSGSTPYIKNGKGVCSLPGNYGKCFIENLKKLGLDDESIFFQYDIQKDQSEIDLNNNKKLKDLYYSKINVLIQSVFQKGSYKIDLQYTEYDKYSDKGKDLAEDKNGIITIPFILTYKNKSADCEISFVGPSYYNYQINGKNFIWSKQFYEAIQKDLM